MALITDYLSIEHLTVNITPSMRRFAAENFGDPGWLEEWVRGMQFDGDPKTLQPFTAECLWKQLIRMLPYVPDEDGEPW